MTGRKGVGVGGLWRAMVCSTGREYLFQLTDHTGMNPVKLVVKLTEEEPLVASAEHDLNYRAQISQLPLPTCPFYA